MDKLSITLDGKAGVGKTTLAEKLSTSLNLSHIETGLIYRAVALLCIEKKFDIDSTETKTVINSIDIRIRNSKTFVLNDNKTINEIELRSKEIEKFVGKIAGHEQLRSLIQKKIVNLSGKYIRVIVVGRQTYKLFPSANMHIFLDASIENRVYRRAKEFNRSIEEEFMLITNRDNFIESLLIDVDKNKFCYIDNSNMTIEETVDRILKHLRRRGLGC